MPRLTRKKIKKAGLPSGTLIYTGERTDGKIVIQVVDYDENGFEEKSVSSVEECIVYKDKPTATWINVDGVHDAVLLEKFG